MALNLKYILMYNAIECVMLHDVFVVEITRRLFQIKEKKGTATADEHYTTRVKDQKLDSTSLFISVPFKLALTVFKNIHQGQENSSNDSDFLVKRGGKTV